MHKFEPRAYIKKLGWLVPVERIYFDIKAVEVDLTDGNGDTAEYNFDEVELMQCTGIKDKNGKLIYEGDLVRHELINLMIKVFSQEAENNEQKEFAISPVNYSIKRGSFKLGAGNKDEKYWCITAYKDIEVIGNIYKNGDLVQESGV